MYMAMTNFKNVTVKDIFFIYLYFTGAYKCMGTAAKL